MEENNTLSVNLDEFNENVSFNFNDVMLAEKICEKIEKDSRRYRRYLGNDSKAVFL